MELELKAYAKINLTLDVLYRRPDGYHQLRSVMAQISLYDRVRLAAAGDVSLACSLPLPADNTAMRAARLFYGATGRGAGIYIEKRIPSEAGLGGASADAAAVLHGLNRLYGRPVPAEELLKMGLEVGADVPFCMTGGLALAEGVGEELTPLPYLPMELVIAKGAAGVSTAGLFRGLSLPVEHPDTAAAIAAIEAGEAAALPPHCRNALEPAATTLCPEIAMVKEALLRAGAAAAFMTGSGAAVVGIFPDAKSADAAAAGLSLPGVYRCRTLPGLSC